MVHFFALGALLFAADRFLNEEPRKVTVTPGVNADLVRRLTDQHGVPPTEHQRTFTIEAWKREEALYREALRRGLDRNDPNIRSLLVGKMYAEAELSVRFSDPDDATLERFLEEERARYERPQRYDFEFFAFPRSDGQTEEELTKFLARLEAGEKPNELGRPLFGATLAPEDFAGRVAAPLAARIVDVPLGTWTRVEGETEAWLLRVKEVSGGLPPLSEVRAAVLDDFKSKAREKAVREKLDKIIALYEFEEVP